MCVRKLELISALLNSSLLTIVQIVKNHVFHIQIYNKLQVPGLEIACLLLK